MEIQPGRLAGAAGVCYDEFTRLSEDVPVHAPHESTFSVCDGAAASRITYIGTVPNAPFTEALFRWVTPDDADPWREAGSRSP
ncbi:hypothetical protein [Phytoactinopolyspora halotolerans]|uniref:Uncharacterized protein n=1 Tax=Phytoactinopolyspora halotolerans TaxID=1981512 RepID=A0A6L9S8T8_9ACTN|nr:hypothetical protein [Phytoactinopolyspora halotolerans]NEE01479.1 hypothetical protein [Phytoactinopolyspora halotolerans]